MRFQALISIVLIPVLIVEDWEVRGGLRLMRKKVIAQDLKIVTGNRDCSPVARIIGVQGDVRFSDDQQVSKYLYSDLCKNILVILDQGESIKVKCRYENESKTIRGQRSWSTTDCPDDEPRMFRQNYIPLSSGVLKQGDTGAAVGVLQQRLFRLGFYDGEITNYFDGRTEQAVIAFQRAYGIQTTGQVEPTTVSYLIRATGEGIPSVPAVPVANPLPSGVLKQGDTGAAVGVLQQRLFILGFYDGEITNYFDARTEQAVIAFQRAYGLSGDGIVGPNTYAALGLASVPNSPTLPQAPVSQGQPLNPVPLALSPLSKGVIGIGQGDQGPGVRDLQTRLRQLGYYNSEPTGFFDSITLDAVIRFQQANQIPATGLVSEETLVFLNNRVAVLPENPIIPTSPTSRILRRGDNDPRVGVLQQRLSWLGYYDGRITEEFDERTEQAVINFQRANGIQPTGQVGPTTEFYIERGIGAL